MPEAAAMVAISLGSQIYQNQVAQKAKGNQPKLPAFTPPPSAYEQDLAAGKAADLAGQAATLGLKSGGIGGTILTSERGAPQVVPQRKTLLGV